MTANPVDNAADAAMNGPEARSQNSVDGTGVKIGIISYSFDTQGGSAADIANGALPASGVTVLSDGVGPSNDEGRAMAEMVHSTAPGAQLYFASAGTSDASFAAAIAALQKAGCTVIVDGYRFADEPFFQAGGLVASAVDTAVAAGVSYVTAAGNLGSQFYQHSIIMKPATLPGGVGAANAYDFNLGVGTPNPLQSVTVPLNATVSFDLQWNQPFKTIGTASAGSAFTLNLYLFNAAGQLVAQATQNAQGGNPVQTIFNYQNTTGTTGFSLAITAGNGVPTGVLKYIVLDSSGVTINDPNAGIGSGTLIGQQMDPNAITVGDVAAPNTPEAGGTLTLQTDTSVGPGQALLTASGTPVASPAPAGKVNVVGPVGSTTSLPGLSPYYGTSGAAASIAGVVALMRQADPTLTPADISALLADSALTVPKASSAAAGAGLVQADRAVTFARTGLITAATGGTHLFQGTSQPEAFAVGAGANTISLGSGASLVVSAGADTIAVGSGNATVNVAGAGALVFGGAAPLLLNAGSGNNTLFGGLGAETVVAGAGSGIYFGGVSGHNVLVGGAGQSLLVAGGDGDQLFAGAGGGDVLFGTASGSVLMAAGASTTGNIDVALASNDAIATGAGANTLFLGSGNDTVFDNGQDTMFGSTGNATIIVNAGNLFLEAGSGLTMLNPGAGVNTVFGTTGSETVTGGAGGGLYRGGYGGNNSLTAGSAATTLVGANTGDILTARMYSSVAKILDWFATHPGTYSACQMVIRYSPYGNYADYITSLTNGIRLNITQGGGFGRVVDATLFTPGQ